jgi:N-ethylmaleimide reductase
MEINYQLYAHAALARKAGPRALAIEEIRQTVADFAMRRARRSRPALTASRFMARTCYLLQQVLALSAHTRADQYGASIENRARFAIEVATAVGADKTAIRLSERDPYQSYEH